MSQFYKKYCWKGGIPYGLGTSETGKLEGVLYKIVMDPYRKRISIEEYFGEKFSAIIYDSALLDFRHLKTMDQSKWEKTTLEDTPEKTVCLIRNHDDRIVFIETYRFEGNFCRECQTHSPHGFLLSTHQMFYTQLKDPYNGAILYDQNNRIVMRKIYNADQHTGEFTELFSEEWDVKENLIPA
jgi:hypothetical protein